MKILYIKNNENIVEIPEDWEAGKKRFNSLTADTNVSNLSLITTIKDSNSNSEIIHASIEYADTYELEDEDVILEEDSE